MNEPELCPHCTFSLQGQPIPQEYIDKGFYSTESTHYSLKMGTEIPGVYDGVLYWSCPNCGKAWPRFTHENTPDRELAWHSKLHADLHNE